MQCKTCGKANCYAHGGKIKLSKNHGDNEHLYAKDEGTSKQGHKIRSANRSESWSKDERSSSPRTDKALAKDYRSEAKEEAGSRLEKSRKLPKPKLKGLAHGGKVDMYAMDPDVPSMHGYAKGGKVSDKERMAGVAKKQEEVAKKHFKPLEGEAKERDDKYLTRLKAHHEADEFIKLKPRKKMLAEGGEVDLPDLDDADGMDVDSELNDMVAEELLSALENKDKKGILEAIRALVMSCGGQE